MTNRPRTRMTGLAAITNPSLLAPLRCGMVPGIEPISYIGRLRKELRAVHSSRQNMREAKPLSFFLDVVGRLDMIRGLRYVLVLPESGPGRLPSESGTWWLSLNGTSTIPLGRGLSSRLKGGNA